MIIVRFHKIKKTCKFKATALWIMLTHPKKKGHTAILLTNFLTPHIKLVHYLSNYSMCDSKVHSSN